MMMFLLLYLKKGANQSGWLVALRLSLQYSCPSSSQVLKAGASDGGGGGLPVPTHLSRPLLNMMSSRCCFFLHTWSDRRGGVERSPREREAIVFRIISLLYETSGENLLRPLVALRRALSSQAGRYLPNIAPSREERERERDATISIPAGKRKQSISSSSGIPRRLACTLRAPNPHFGKEETQFKSRLPSFSPRHTHIY